MRIEHPQVQDGSKQHPGLILICFGPAGVSVLSRPNESDLGDFQTLIQMCEHMKSDYSQTAAAFKNSL